MFKLFKKKKQESEINKLPHEIFPEIVFYEKNDLIWSYNTCKFYNYICIDEFGTVFLSYSKKLVETNLTFLKKCFNESLNTRKYTDFMKNSDDMAYMIFLNEIKNNYKYLKG